MYCSYPFLLFHLVFNLEYPFLRTLKYLLKTPIGSLVQELCLILLHRFILYVRSGEVTKLPGGEGQLIYGTQEKDEGS